MTVIRTLLTDGAGVIIQIMPNLTKNKRKMCLNKKNLPQNDPKKGKQTSGDHFKRF